MWLLYVLIGVLVLLIIFAFIYSSKLYIASSNIIKAFRELDLILKEKLNLVLDLYDKLNNYIKDDKLLCEDLENLKNINYDNLNKNAKFKLGSIVTGIFGRLEDFINNNKNLKNTETVISIIKASKAADEKHSMKRIGYNEDVRIYNELVTKYPSKIIAKLFGFKEKEYYGILDGERKSIKTNI